MNDNELLARSSYWLTIILGSLYLKRWKIFWLEIFIIIILYYLTISNEDFIENQFNKFDLKIEFFYLFILLIIPLIFRIICIIAIRNARKLIRNSL